jgi:radical SAM superfamily enzyme YgiQ (UPF0313 family)
MGRQPFGLASPAAWLEREGCRVRCVDLSLDELPPDAVAAAELIAFHIPMHTATRLAARAVEVVRAANPRAHLCFYGLYAPLNEDYLRGLGAGTVLGGEFESGLVRLVRGLRLHDTQPPPVVSLERQEFLVPDRSGLPGLERYARLHLGDGREVTAGYTEASRGCRYLCRHCPVVPVYGGRFRIVQHAVVLEDVRQQVAAGAGHITFGDPDFLNGPGHAFAVVEALHREFPELTYDVGGRLDRLLATGCLFVTTAVEALDDRVLGILDKGHTRADFLAAVELARSVGLPLSPTFVTFTPWTTRQGYLELLETIRDLGLVDHVAPVQYAIRLLVTASSGLLEREDVRGLVGEFDADRLVWPWRHRDPRVDRLQEEVFRLVHEASHRGEERRDVFEKLWRLAHRSCERSVDGALKTAALDRAAPRATVPYMTEPWYC